MTPQKLSHQEFRLGVSAFYMAHATMPLLFRHAVSHCVGTINSVTFMLENAKVVIFFEMFPLVNNFFQY